MQQKWPPVKKFVPSNQHEARKGIRASDSEAYHHHKNYFDVSKDDKRDDHQLSKAQRLTKNGFVPAQHYDNARLPDWGKNHKDRKALS